jgi:NADPH:quinone reductase-like Zn-dependent oxidoreductase
MKAIVHDEYGSSDVLHFQDIDMPPVNDNEVLVEVRAASPNPWDWHFMRGEPYVVRIISGLRRPRPSSVLGSDVAGRVEAVGKGVTRFLPGDEVFENLPPGVSPADNELGWRMSIDKLAELVEDGH